MTISADKYNKKIIIAHKVVPEELTALTTEWQKNHDLVQDGMYGPRTKASVRASFTKGPRITGGFNMFDGPLKRVPTNRAEVYEIFGNPGAVRLDKAWKKKNIVKLKLPDVKNNLWVHKLAVPYFREAYRRALRVSNYKPEKAGTFNFRHIRHDPKRPLSMHSWGIAVDFDASKNWYKVYKRGEAPQIDTTEYKRQWPAGVDRAFVEAFRSCWFTWGSDWDNDGRTDDHSFLDPMHFELVWRGK